MIFNLNRIMFILFCALFVNTYAFATPAGIGFEVLIIKPDDTPLEAPSVDFKFKITDPLGTCVIYIEELNAQDMTASQGQKSFTIGNPSLQAYPDPMVTPLTIAQVFSNSGRTFACQSGGSYTSASVDKRQLLLEFNDGSGAQVLSAVDINSVPFALEAASITGMPTCTANQSISFNGSSFTCVTAISSVTSANSYLSVATTTTTPVLTLNVGTAINTVAAGNDSRFTDERTPLNNSVTSAKIVDGTISSADISTSAIQASHLSQMGASSGQVMKWDGASWVASSDNSGSGSLVTSVAGRTGVVTLSSGDISGLAFGTTAGTFAQGNDSRFTDTRTPTDNSVTSAKILDGTIAAADLSSMDASVGQVMKWNGSAWVASSDNTGGGGSVTNVSASGPLSSSGGATPNISLSQANGTTDGYLSSADWTTFSAKLSDFSSLLSSDITSKLGYTPVNPATAVTSVAGRTGVVTLSSGDISGLAFGTTAGTYAQGNDSRFTDTRTPTDNSVTSAKILDGTIASADISAGAITFDKLNQTSAISGQVIKWNGSAWVASSDDTGAGGTVTNVSASGPLSSSGGGTPNITIAKANGTTDGYLSSADFTTFAAKLSDFSTLLSSDITSKLGYTPVNPATAVTSVAGRTGVVTLSSGDISGLAFGTTAGTFAQGNDSRFTDTRTPTDNSVTSAKIVDGTITSADISDASIEANKLAQMDASVGQVMKWNGSAWVASSDLSNGGTVTTVTASGPLSSSGGATPNISLSQANGTTDGYLSSADFTTFAAKLSDFSTLLSSDITSKLGYTPVNPSTLGSAALLNSSQVVLVSNMPANCNAGQTLTFSSPTGSWVCSSIVLGSNTVTSAMITSLDWTKVVNTPTTAAGYGIPKATAAVDGYLSSADWTTFNSKLSNFSTLTSSDVTTRLGYTPLNPSNNLSELASSTTARTNLGLGTAQSPTFAGLTLSGITGNTLLRANGSGVLANATSADITGLLGFAAIDGSVLNATNLTSGTIPTARFPALTGDVTTSAGAVATTIATGAVTSAKILDGTIASADISSSAITFDKLNQSSATTGQVIKWSGSAWIASADSTGGSGGLPAAGGTASAPGYAFSGDTNTGMFSSIADTLGFSTAGVEQMTITPTGKVGIGTNDPYFDFEVAKSDEDVFAGVSHSGYGTGTKYSGFYANHYMGPANAGTSRVIFNVYRGAGGSPSAIQSGDILGEFLSRGGSDTAWSVRDGASIAFTAEGNFTNSSSPARVAFSTTPSASVVPVERMRIASDGNVGIGSTSPAARLDVNGEVKFGNTSSTCNGTNEGQQRYNSTSKNMEFCNGTAWTAYSTGGGGLSGCPTNYTLVQPSSTFGTNAFCINPTVNAGSNSLDTAFNGCSASGASLCLARQIKAAHVDNVGPIAATPWTANTMAYTVWVGDRRYTTWGTGGYTANLYGYTISTSEVMTATDGSGGNAYYCCTD